MSALQVGNPMNKRKIKMRDCQVPRCVHFVHVAVGEAISMLMFNRCLYTNVCVLCVCVTFRSIDAIYTAFECNITTAIQHPTEWNALLTRA